MTQDQKTADRIREELDSAEQILEGCAPKPFKDEFYKQCFYDAQEVINDQADDIVRLRDALRGVLPYLRLDHEPIYQTAAMVGTAHALRAAADAYEMKERAIQMARETSQSFDDTKEKP